MNFKWNSFLSTIENNGNWVFVKKTLTKLEWTFYTNCVFLRIRMKFFFQLPRRTPRNELFSKNSPLVQTPPPWKSWPALVTNSAQNAKFEKPHAHTGSNAQWTCKKEDSIAKDFTNSTAWSAVTTTVRYYL